MKRKVKKKWIVWGCIIGILLFNLVRCMPPPTPLFRAFSKELMHDHPNIIKCDLYAPHSPSFYVVITGDQTKIGMDERKEIGKKVIRFVLSEKAYPEIIGYYDKVSNRGFGKPSDFYVYLSPTVSGGNAASFVSHVSHENRDDPNTHGFDDWDFEISQEDKDYAGSFTFNEIMLE